jgi:glycine/D-amino acid oxidase-like deaminating enzyme
MAHRAEYDTVIVGGGFFGCCLAIHLQQSLGRRVVVLEREPDLLQRASYANQARVHHGYHYPRSLLTALRCRVNFPRFVADYRDCVISDFAKYYAVGRRFSKVTAAQYRQFCERIGAPIAPAPKAVRRLFNPHLVEDVFAVTEYAFDAVKLKEMVREKLRAAGVEVRLDTEAGTVGGADGAGLAVTCRGPAGDDRITARAVLNCTYSRLNRLLAASGLPTLYLKHELTEMALVAVPDELRHCGITMMCGPFFSVMPFPPLGLHTLSHVRYTPHCEGRDHDGGAYRDPYEMFARLRKRTRFPHMIRDAARYLPSLAGCRYADSIWEVKTVLPKSEVDDSRPVLYRRDCGLPNLTSLMGGKIDNIYDILEFEAAAYN